MNRYAEAAYRAPIERVPCSAPAIRTTIEECVECDDAIVRSRGSGSAIGMTGAR